MHIEPINKAAKVANPQASVTRHERRCRRAKMVARGLSSERPGISSSLSKPTSPNALYLGLCSWRSPSSRQFLAKMVSTSIALSASSRLAPDLFSRLSGSFSWLVFPRWGTFVDSQSSLLRPSLWGCFRPCRQLQERSPSLQSISPLPILLHAEC